MVGLILKTGTKVSSTGFIKIVSDARHSKCSTDLSHFDYELLAAEYDPAKNKTIPGPWFNVTEEEVKQWIMNS